MRRHRQLPVRLTTTLVTPLAEQNSLLCALELSECARMVDGRSLQTHGPETAKPRGP